MCNAVIRYVAIKTSNPRIIFAKKNKNNNNKIKTNQKSCDAKEKADDDMTKW